MILFYAPAWWLQIPVICTPFSWEDTSGFIREKLGKKKKVKLPPSLTVPAAAGAGSRPAVRRPAVPAPEEETAGQIDMNEWMSREVENTPPEAPEEKAEA